MGTKLCKYTPYELHFLGSQFFVLRGKKKDEYLEMDILLNILNIIFGHPIVGSVIIIGFVTVILALIKHNKIGRITSFWKFKFEEEDDGKEMNNAILVLESIYNDFSNKHFDITNKTNDEKQNIKSTAIERAINVFNMALINFNNVEVNESLKKYRLNGIRMEELFNIFLKLNFSDNLMSVFSKIDNSIELKNSTNEQTLPILERLSNDAIFSIITDCRKFPIDNEVDFLTRFISELKDSLKSSMIDIFISYIKASRDEQIAIQSLVEERKKTISNKLLELGGNSKKKVSKQKGEDND